MEASTVARVLIDRVFSHLCTPLQILTVRGRNFESRLFNQLCKRSEIDHITTTAFKPSTNGLVERFHRTLNSILAKVVSENQRDWDEHLPYAVAAYRATAHECTGYSLNLLFLSHEVRAPIDLVLGVASHDKESFSRTNDFISHQQVLIGKRYSEVRQALGKAASRQKKYYDMRVHPQTVKPGGWVWYFLPRRRVGRSPKWHKWYTGPFMVVRQEGPVNYKLQRTQHSESFVSRVDKLKICLQGHPPSWLPSQSGNTVPEDLPVIQLEHSHTSPTPQNSQQADLADAGNRDLRTEGNDPTHLHDMTHGTEQSERPQRQHRVPARYRNDCVILCASQMDSTAQRCCRYCQKSFQNIKALRSHIRLLHRQEKVEVITDSTATLAPDPFDNQRKPSSPDTSRESLGSTT